MEGLNAGTSQTSPTLGAIEPLSWAETPGGHRDSPETLPHCWSCRVLDVLVGMMVGIVVDIAVVTMVGIMEDSWWALLRSLWWALQWGSQQATRPAVKPSPARATRGSFRSAKLY